MYHPIYPTSIESWEFVGGCLKGVVPTGTGYEKTIRTSKVKRRNGLFIETVNGGYYLLSGLSRKELIEQARSSQTKA